jgi:hypothetical protein
MKGLTITYDKVGIGSHIINNSGFSPHRTLNKSIVNLKKDKILQKNDIFSDALIDIFLPESLVLKLSG